MLCGVCGMGKPSFLWLHAGARTELPGTEQHRKKRQKHYFDKARGHRLTRWLRLATYTL